MITRRFIWMALLLVGIAACKEAPSPDAIELAPNAPPEEVYGQLFVDVQMAGIFPDSKTFPDCTPKLPPADILAKYKKAKRKSDFDLKAFVEAHFDLPPVYKTDYESSAEDSVSAHIETLWGILMREGGAPVEGSSLLPLPKPYVVPGGRFGEIYYWDSYFTMLGLRLHGRMDLVESMVSNFAHLIEAYGHIPNGNRTYFLSRSQPPFFSLMVELIGEQDSTRMLEYLPQLEKEYAFWMDGEAKLGPDSPAHRRAVYVDGQVMNRYWDDRPAPRPESYREDVELAKASGRDPEELYRNLRAACESGWDFSSRWLQIEDRLGTIRTTEFLPVDQNCLMWNLEKLLARLYAMRGDKERAAAMAQRRDARARFIREKMWDAQRGFYYDYHVPSSSLAPHPSLAGTFPLFFGIATPEQAKSMAKALGRSFLQEGGLTTTLNIVGQQWDAPNGWAPLQWIAIKGLRDYGHGELAEEAARRWVRLNRKVFHNTGKMMEKYDVQDMSLEAGGGEYPVQDGFGWTNGVFIQLISDYEGYLQAKPLQ